MSEPTFTSGEWEVSYGEIWSGGDIAIMTTTPGGAIVRVATLLEAPENDGELPLDGDEKLLAEICANAELLRAAPEMYRLLRRFEDAHPNAIADVRMAVQRFMSDLDAKMAVNAA